jgi:peroxygenase
MQQHVAFFDADRDGIIWPSDTFKGFCRLGFGILFSLLGSLFIHLNFAYPTQESWVPDPRMLIHVRRIHKNKHGSDTGSYDKEGKFSPEHFEGIFARYADGRDYLTAWDTLKVWNGQKCIMGPIGLGAAFFECKSLLKDCLAVCLQNRAHDVSGVMARRWESEEGGHPPYI